MSDDIGGTPIVRNNQGGIQQMGPPPSMGPQMGPQMGQQMGGMPQQMSPEEQYMRQQMAMQQQAPPPQRSILKKTSKFGGNTPFDFDSIAFKNGLLVAVIFLLLNSKIIWSQIMKIPFMGSMEPSVVALITNAILAGIVFYIISNLI